MLRETTAALRRSPDPAGVLVVGGLLTLLSWLVIPVWVGGALVFPPIALFAPLALAPALVARGYFVRVLAAGVATGNVDGAPSFVGWNELYVNGLKSTLLSVVLLAPLGLGLAAVALAGGALAAGVVDPAPVADTVRELLGAGGGAAVVGVAGAVVAATTAVYLLAFAYVRPAALAAFAASGRLRDGLRPGRVARVAGSGTYAAAWVVAVATLGAGYALSGPFVPLLVGFVFVFVVRVAGYGLYGRGAAATLDAGGAVAAVDEETTTPAGDDPSGSSGPSQSTGPSQSLPSEVPPAVQTGRSVPVVGADGGFDWLTAEGETPRDGDATPDAFEWASDAADPEDKR